MKNVIIGLIMVGMASTICACGSGGNQGQEQQQALVTDINVDEFKSLKDEQPGIILDVRTPGEVAEGIVENAVVIDITQANFMEEVAKLEKGKPIYVYCKAGGRSANASQKLIDLGYTKVYNVMGGMDDWKAKGYPTVQ